MKRAVVTGAGGFIATHLVRLLKLKGYRVRGVDIKQPEYSPTAADEFLLLDLRDPAACREAFAPGGTPFDEVYHLAADMGGMGFIHAAECEIMRNNALTDIGVVHAAAEAAIPRYFFSSSVCVYRDMQLGEPELAEGGAYPAMPDNEYGWEKLYAERVALTYARHRGIEARIARFQNCYGPEGTWTGGREKAPAAICRKVAEARDGGTIEIWGDGSAVRSYVYVADLVDAIYRFMQSDVATPVNIGSPEYVSVSELVRLVAETAGKRLRVRSVPGPVGVRSRNFSNDLIASIGWRPTYSLRRGIELTYPWIAEQVEAARRSARAAFPS